MIFDRSCATNNVNKTRSSGADGAGTVLEQRMTGRKLCSIVSTEEVPKFLYIFLPNISILFFVFGTFCLNRSSRSSTDILFAFSRSESLCCCRSVACSFRSCLRTLSVFILRALFPTSSAAACPPCIKPTAASAVRITMPWLFGVVAGQLTTEFA